MAAVIPPGSTVGVLGGGQLGRMFAMAARRLGYRVHTLAPEHDTPTGQLADVEVNAPYDDLDAIRRFARAVDVVTFEFENVSADAAAVATEHAIVRPSGRALAVAQHRLREKTFVGELGVAVTPFAPVRSAEELLAAARAVGFPAVLKTASFGYDGKGQVWVPTVDDLEAAWNALGRHEAILETFVDLDREISVIAARGVSGDRSAFPVFENTHQHHILDITVAPASVNDKIAEAAVESTFAIMEALEYVGLLCVEFFVTKQEQLYVNEIAPRPHNSGHLTFDGCRTSQFEQQLRAICGLPLGSTELLQPAAMVNLLGDLWSDGAPNWPAALAFPDVKLHLYGKTAARPGRKMGHLTALAPTRDEAKTRVLAARTALTARPSTEPASS
ncbi:MAG TPA: 5-(carboxyamino)imidazole ribonucleotide synthase [Vicinamibacterales bacterium]